MRCASSSRWTQEEPAKTSSPHLANIAALKECPQAFPFSDALVFAVGRLTFQSLTKKLGADQGPGKLTKFQGDVMCPGSETGFNPDLGIRAGR